MTKGKKNNISSLLNGIGEDVDSCNVENSKPDEKKPISKELDDPSNPAIALATGKYISRAKTVKEPILHLQHDQVSIFKYHDRHESSLRSNKLKQLKEAIESEEQHFPGVVRKTDRVTDDGRMVYELIVGRLRFEATRDIGFFKAMLRDLDDQQAVKLMLSENEDRFKIAPFERWLSILPLVKEDLLSIREIAEATKVDPGNLSRSLKARRFFEECDLDKYLIDVESVKLQKLIDIGNEYLKDPEKVTNALKVVLTRSPNIRNNRLLLAISNELRVVSRIVKETIQLDDLAVKIERDGENLRLYFDGLPNAQDLETIIPTLSSKGFLKT